MCVQFFLLQDGVRVAYYAHNVETTVQLGFLHPFRFFNIYNNGGCDLRQPARVVKIVPSKGGERRVSVTLRRLAVSYTDVVRSASTLKSGR